MIQFPLQVAVCHYQLFGKIARIKEALNPEFPSLVRARILDGEIE